MLRYNKDKEKRYNTCHTCGVHVCYIYGFVDSSFFYSEDYYYLSVRSVWIESFYELTCLLIIKCLTFIKGFLHPWLFFYIIRWRFQPIVILLNHKLWMSIFNLWRNGYRFGLLVRMFVRIEQLILYLWRSIFFKSSTP